MIGHPDIDGMSYADVDRNEVAAERHDVCRQSADAHAELDRTAMSRAGVGAQRDDPFDARLVESTLREILVHLGCLLVNDAVMRHLVEALWQAESLDVLARSKRIDMQ